MRKLGYLPSNGNYHGLSIEGFYQSPTVTYLGANKNPDSYIIPEAVPAFDQGILSSCTANGCSMAYAILAYLINPSNINYLSRLFLYFNGRVPAGIQNQDDGTYIHLVVNSLKTLGACLETTWDYVPTMVNSQPSIPAYKEANSNVINNFYEITSSGQNRTSDICAAIKANHPVIFGTQVGSDLENYNGNPSTVFDIPVASTIQGGHCMLITGFRINSQGQKEFLCKNSWSPWFGISNGISSLQGYFWMSESYTNWNQTNDLFVLSQYQNLLI